MTYVSCHPALKTKALLFNNLRVLSLCSLQNMFNDVLTSPYNLDIFPLDGVNTTFGANKMTNKQIAASRDYNYSVLWFWNRRAGFKPAEIAADHEKLLTMWYDHPDPATRQAIDYADRHNWTV